jgi:SNF2 family DNA or RNA helicase
MLYRLRDVADRRRGLTGTPYTNNLLSVFGQMLFVEPGILGTNFYQFREKWAILDEWGSVLDYKNKAGLQSLLDIISIRYMLSEVHPEIQDDIEQTLYVTLPPAIMRAYKELRDEMYTEVWDADDRCIPIEANNTLTRILRLNQLAGGHAGRTDAIQQGDGTIRKVSTVEHVHTAKEEALADWIEDLGDDHPAVVFVNFQPEIKRVKQVVSQTGRLAYELSGSRNEWLEWMADQDHHVPALWPDGKAPIMVAQIDSGAAGIDFTRCNGRFVHYVCYFSMGNKLVNYTQSRGRVHRPGTDVTQRISVTHILAEGTIDEDVYESTLTKQEIITLVLDKIRKERPRNQEKT